MPRLSQLNRRVPFSGLGRLALLGILSCFATVTRSDETVSIGLTVTTPLAYPNTPMSVEIDFAEQLRQRDVPGVLDPNSIRVINIALQREVAMARTEDFAYRDRGRVEWVIAKPHHVAWEIRFRAVPSRLPLKPQSYVPAIGVGDLLRFNAGRRRPVTMFFSAGLHDLTGDGRPDLVGCWNYAYRDGDPWAAPIVYPSVDAQHPWQFGNLQRLRFFEPDAPARLKDFNTHYSSIDMADFNRDGRLDLIHLDSNTRSARIFLGTPRRQPGGCPLFAGSVSFKVAGRNNCRAIDLDGNGTIDLVLGTQWHSNTNPEGWPLQLAKPVSLSVGSGSVFVDLDGDNRPDAVHPAKVPPGPAGGRMQWRKHLGGTPPVFSDPVDLDGISYRDCTMVGAATIDKRQLLIVQHDVFQQLNIFERVKSPTGRPTFREIGRAESAAAVLSLSDQAWPCLRDWDNDGDNDLLVGGGYGWPRIVINSGTRTRPVYDEPKLIASDGRPIKFLRNEILGPPDGGHNMGYPYPVLVDWDGDGLQDLFCPNETNRLFWFRNTGTAAVPRFGPRRQVLCDGFPDSPAFHKLSATRARSPQSNHGVYPYEKERPFMWRTGNAIADFNDDGLMDFVTVEGSTPRASLFVQYRNGRGLRLRRQGEIRLTDGREVNDKIVNRTVSWGQTFRATDWNRDGRVDLLYSVGGSHHGTLDGGSMYLLLNVGTRKQPVFAPPRTLKCYGRPIRITNHGPHAWVGDYDHDGLPDVVGCVEWSVYPYYSHAALMMPAAPEYRLNTPKR